VAKVWAGLCTTAAVLAIPAGILLTLWLQAAGK
jgi:hypothetical protein